SVAGIFGISNTDGCALAWHQLVSKPRRAVAEGDTSRVQPAFAVSAVLTRTDSLPGGAGRNSRGRNGRGVTLRRVNGGVQQSRSVDRHTGITGDRDVFDDDVFVWASTRMGKRAARTGGSSGQDGRSAASAGALARLAETAGTGSDEEARGSEPVGRAQADQGTIRECDSAGRRTKNHRTE